MATNKDKGQLKSQLERVLDFGRGNYRDVIIRMRDDEEAVERIIGGATEGVERRRLALTARDVLPASRRTIERARTTSGRRKLRSMEFSLAAQVAGHAAAALLGIQPSTIGSIVAAARSVLSAAMESEPIKAARKRSQEGARHASPVREFWSSRSFAATLTPSELRQLVDDVPDVAEVFVNRRLSLPPYVEIDAGRLAFGAEETNAGVWGLRTIGALAAWGAFDVKGRDTVIAVLDTGIDPDHPALDGRLADWAEFDRFGNKVEGSQPHDTDRHGTHVAGTIAGGQADGRWIGVAPDAKIAAALVLNGEQGGSDAQILAGMEWAIEAGVDAINLSLGGIGFGPEVPSTYTRTIISALRAGIPVVAAIGNEGHQTSGSPGNDLFALSVGATDHLDRVAGFSGGRTQLITESQFIDARYLPLTYSTPQVSAPGVGVLSSVPGGGLAPFSGTSMATPHVAGAIALLLSATTLKSLPPEDRAFVIQDLLVGSVEELGEAGQDHRYGFGRIDVLRAISEAKARGF